MTTCCKHNNEYWSLVNQLGLPLFEPVNPGVRSYNIALG